LYRSKIERAKTRVAHGQLFEPKKKKRKGASKTSDKPTGASPIRRSRRKSSAELTPSQTQLSQKKYRLIKISEVLKGTEAYQKFKTSAKWVFAPIKIIKVPRKLGPRGSVTVDTGNPDIPDAPYDGTKTLKVHVKDLRMLVDMIEEAGSVVGSPVVETPSPTKSASSDSKLGSESDEDNSTDTQGDGDQSKSKGKDK
jgi:hypothetical protein